MRYGGLTMGIDSDKAKPGQETGLNDAGTLGNAKSKFITFSDLEALLHLKNLYLSDHRSRFPNWPEHYRTVPKWDIRTTNGLTRAVINFLKLLGHHVERTGNEGRIIDNRQLVSDHMGHTRMIGSVQRVRGSGMRGTSDLKAVIKDASGAGRFVGIEIKNASTGDRQRPEQKVYQQRIEQAGGVYVIATSLGQLMTWYYSFIGEDVEDGRG